MKLVSVRSSTLALLVAGAAALAACAEAPDAPLAAERAALVSANAISANAISANAISANAISANAISANAISANAISANAISANAISANGLIIGEVDHPDLVLALHDPYAQEFMKYLVSCALEPKQQVTYTDPFTGQKHAWNGALALCPSWLAKAPDQACQERVSACLLARQNAFAQPVQLSLRGHDAVGPIALGSSVGQFSWKLGPSPVQSHAACRGGRHGAQRACGFWPGEVGVCTPGDKVVLEGFCQSRPLAADRGVFRVCDGQNGCDPKDAEHLLSIDGDCDRLVDIVFQCPVSGQFSVMVGADDPRVAIAVSVSGPGYPASEAAVFRWREGAFYGNLFGQKNLAPDAPRVRVNPETGVVEELAPDGDTWVPGRSASEKWRGLFFPNMWACWSDNWAYPSAYLLRRVCAGPNADACVATPVGPCSKVCQTQDDGPKGDFDYQFCTDGVGQLWEHALTPLLAAPCDLMPGDPACKTTSAVPSLPW
jgi:hypothetical protein